MPDYQQAKIYRIVNDSMPGKVYYGSTCQKLSMRMASHRLKAKTKNYASKQLFETGKALIILVEDFPCNSKKELHNRERFYIENNDCVNYYIPGRGRAEYHLDNKDKINKYSSEYYQNHKEQVKQQNKEKETQR